MKNEYKLSFRETVKRNRPSEWEFFYEQKEWNPSDHKMVYYVWFGMCGIVWFVLWYDLFVWYGLWYTWVDRKGFLWKIHTLRG